MRAETCIEPPALAHEPVLAKWRGEQDFSGYTPSQRSHAKLMARGPEMKREDDSSAVGVSRAEAQELTWKSSKPSRATSSSPVRCRATMRGI